MFTFYALFSALWIIILSVHFWQLKRNRMLDSFRLELMTLALPLSMTLYSLLNTLNWLHYELTGYSSAGVHFSQVLVVLLLRIGCYSLVVLLVKGYSSLRVTFSKMEWRTLMGLVMFGTMGDLISEASDSKDWRSYMLSMSYQVTLALYCVFTCWTQKGAIRNHLDKLNQVRHDYQNFVAPSNLDYTIHRYRRLYHLQRINLAIFSLGAVVGLGGATWLRWRLANLPKEALDFPSLGIALLDQIQYLAIYGYFAICILQDYLPPV